MESKKKVFVGVSGGVDSSVALALLKEQGFDVTGVFLKVWSPDWLPCTWRDERRSAMRVCATLGVPFIALDCEKEYKENIVDYMISEYKAGRTPNPDVFCNKYIKFGVFLNKALEMGADFVATGHYSISQKSKVEIQKWELVEAEDKEKDQSYFLHQLNQEQLSHTLFPIGHLQKSEVRKLAEKYGLPTAEKKDSQGLCFIGKVDMKEFLSHYIESKPGKVLNESGEVIGNHNGAVFYTIGERHGFEITKKSDADHRMFVVAKDMERNTIAVGSKLEAGSSKSEGDEKVIIQDSRFKILASTMNWIDGTPPDLSSSFDIRFRYRQEKQKCQIKINGDVYKIIPEKEQFGVASGQLAVIYDGEVCLGGGSVV
jgi:tRNA-uridine 2-sulfurtransferase